MAEGERRPMTPRDRFVAVLRSRQWHEQRSVAGRCHRCPRLVEQAGWYCRRCRIEISREKAFVRFVRWVQLCRCVECRKQTDGRKLTCAECRRQRKGLNAGSVLKGGLPRV